MAEATRPPERSDLLRVCAELNRLGAKYIVIGGLAMNELGLVRVTEDIDLLIESSPENQHAFARRFVFYQSAPLTN
jgi:hypothetical protein